MTRKVPVEIDGVTYESQAEASRQTGVPQQAISQAHLRGTTHRAGKGRNFHSKHPLALDGKWYESQGAVAAVIGIDCRNLNTICRKHRKLKQYKFTWRNHEFWLAEAKETSK